MVRLAVGPAAVPVGHPFFLQIERQRENSSKLPLAVCVCVRARTWWWGKHIRGGMNCLFHLCFSRDQSKLGSSRTLLEEEWLLRESKPHFCYTPKGSVGLSVASLILCFLICKIKRLLWLIPLGKL